MKASQLKTLFRAAVVSIAALTASAAFAADTATHKVVHGVAIYLGVLPAEMVLGHPRTHTEAEMHGGVPAGQHQHHVVVALFDNATGKRISGAKVSARVHEINLAGAQKKLEPMLIAGTVSRAGFFCHRGVFPADRTSRPPVRPAAFPAASCLSAVAFFHASPAWRRRQHGL